MCWTTGLEVVLFQRDHVGSEVERKRCKKYETSLKCWLVRVALFLSRNVTVLSPENVVLRDGERARTGFRTNSKLHFNKNDKVLLT